MVTCPFCGFKKEGEYFIQLHIEEHHTDDSPFTSHERLVEDAPPSRSNTPDNEWIKCTRPNCGEYMLLADMQEHLDVHEAIGASEQDDEASGRSASTSSVAGSELSQRTQSTLQRSKSGSNERSNGTTSYSSSSTSRSANNRGLLDYLSGTSSYGQPRRRPARSIDQPLHPGRLGKRELGPHAFEERMPSTVRRRLLEGALPRRSTRIGRDGRLVDVRVIDTETAGLM